MAFVDELWLVDFGESFPGEPARRRPALILGPPDSFGPTFPFVMVVPLTKQRRGLSIHIEVEHEEHTGLDVTSYAQCELLRSIRRTRLVHRIGAVDRRTSESGEVVIRTLLNY